MKAREGRTVRGVAKRKAASRVAGLAFAFARSIANIVVVVALLALALQARGADDSASSSGSSAAGDAIERHYELGPVKVDLSVRPAKPVIGDVVELRLEARAEPGVELLMPEFGEALGRFEIVDFAPSEGQGDDGASEARQTYRLQPSRSGAQSIPALRVEFVDRRDGHPAAPDGEDAYEILTERVALEVAPMLASDAPLELRPPHSDLGARRIGGLPPWAWLLGAGATLALAAPLLWRAFVAHRARQRQRSAYEIARSELDALLARGRPQAETVDAFYVQLSLIVRSYLENRFALRSPELTTEEFLNEMGRSPDLARSHQQLLRDFLVQADLVKFAGYRPEAEIVSQSIAAAERFLEDTREAAHA